MRPRSWRWLFVVPAAILGIALFIGIGGWIVMHLWNWLTPALFGWPALTFWQAVGLLALTRILVGGHGFGRGGRGRCRHRMWERWDNMTPEERDRLRHGMRERWGMGDPSTPNPGQS
jgi:hypothetical protein